MYLPRLTQHGFVLLACLLICGGMSSNLHAQATPPAPRLYNPQNRAISNRYQPRFMRPSGMVTSQVINEGNMVQPQVVSTPTPTIAGGGHVTGAPVGDVIVADGGYFDDGFVDGGYVDGGYVGGGGCDGGGCDGGCGVGCGGCGPLYDPRDCGIAQDCWLNGLGGLLCNSEYFAGVQAFKHQVFQDPQGRPQPENCSFGYHFGINAGLPLYNITCGLVSGQFGVNYVRSNLNKGVSQSDGRDQTFITTGLFRRVDYGFQFGAVGDFLTSEYVSDLDIVQIRSEISWVWAGGSNAGFRFNRATQDGIGAVGGEFVPFVRVVPLDTYSLFYRKTCCNGGYLEWYIGRTDEKHTILGGDYDLPIGEKSALYAAFNYVNPDDDLRLTDNEAWNLQMGISFRPRGRDWYKFYHRPLFKVADNGSMVQSRVPFFP